MVIVLTFCLEHSFVLIKIKRDLCISFLFMPKRYGSKMLHFQPLTESGHIPVIKNLYQFFQL